jgi:hypothetical protein
MTKTASYPIAVVEVTRAQLDQYAGLPWGELTAASSGLPVKRTDHGFFGAKQEDRASWLPPRDVIADVDLSWCPIGSAWLREIDGRGFLYMQNW